MPHVYKLRYNDKETAIADLIAKGVYNDDLSYANGTHAVVELGFIVLTYGEYDEEGNVIAEPTYADGYHYDVMTENEIDFGSAELKVKNPKHNFAGYEQKGDIGQNTEQVD
jgi:hypothetical protein